MLACAFDLQIIFFELAGNEWVAEVAILKIPAV